MKQEASFSFQTEEKPKRKSRKITHQEIDSDTDSEDFDEDSFTLVKGYNERIRAIYTFRLKEKVLEGLAYNASRQQLKRQQENEATQFRIESLLIRGFEMLNFHSSIVARMDAYRRRVAFFKLLEACRR